MSLAARARGFTLIEVMVVMLIIGVLATTVTLSLRPDTHRLLSDEGYRFARVLEQAGDAAEMGDMLALSWNGKGYVFSRQDDDGNWSPVGDELLAPHAWPDGIAGGGLLLDGHPWPADKPLLLWQNGRAVALALQLDGAGRKLTVLQSPLGRVTVTDGS
ncbi:type II secretion system protein GspH [Chromobacterium sinusclupearum]|uniref:Type II secretion system protein GspH n=1 Tax=Chromobacterium sinusclupearum TaxID=2077146 RepID=A0A2K4MUA2_9NEIS|nr:prepilin-type N-terminal cleavage/methylation domain-containing protein [Chromobacterium sinusclupearum]POB00674.1 type II secretion system protein GspH [Chromobacterium sinusclupearum]